jgi:RNA polymerase sigma-70 factor (ECF subfamily)
MPNSDPGAPAVRVTEEESYVLATRLRERDPAALDELYQRVQTRAHALARRVLGDAALAEDAVQEALAQLWERAGRITPDGGRIESLLMTIVHRRAVDIARRRDGRESPLPDADLLQPIDERATAMLDEAEDTLTADGLRARLNEALSGLPPEQRTIVKQAYFGDLSLREIAEREGLPLGTVKSRLRLAMAKLTESMRGDATR